MFFSNVSKKERIGLAVAAIIVSLAFLDRLILNPINKRIQQISQEIKISEKQLRMGLRNLNQKEAIISEYGKYSQYFKGLGSEEETTAAMLSEIETVAKKSNMSLLDLKPQPSKDRGFYREYSIEVEAEGTIESLINFIYRLNASTQLLRVEKLRLSLKDKDSGLIKITLLITKISFL
ncbi:MAG: type 4a pilus biogenesis protein PilO [Candidatus Omnitrophica bacterium]|nr:type 4a pilus biogenesis protein PilO [Candidatus Omnitrophota bacterium]